MKTNKLFYINLIFHFESFLKGEEKENIIAGAKVRIQNSMQPTDEFLLAEDAVEDSDTSDDSEDDYTPVPKKGRRKDDSDFDSEEEETLTCVVCPETLKVDINARFHYSVHYYDDNAFMPLLKPDDLKDGKAQDEIGQVFKFTCQHDHCTKRKMGYKEMFIHLAILGPHQQLRQLMMNDKRPGIKQALDRLYPQEGSSLPSR